MSHDHCARIPYSLIVAVIGKEYHEVNSIKSYIYASSASAIRTCKSSSSHPNIARLPYVKVAAASSSRLIGFRWVASLLAGGGFRSPWSRFHRAVFGRFQARMPFGMPIQPVHASRLAGERRRPGKRFSGCLDTVSARSAAMHAS